MVEVVVDGEVIVVDDVVVNASVCVLVEAVVNGVVTFAVDDVPCVVDAVVVVACGVVDTVITRFPAILTVEFNRTIHWYLMCFLWTCLFKVF